MKKTMKTSGRTRKPAAKPLQISIDDLKRIVVHEWWPFIQRKYPKNQIYSPCGRMIPCKIYSNASKKYMIFGFICTVSTYQPTGYEDPTKEIGPCWIGIEFSKRDRHWHLGSEEEFGDYMNEYLDDREAHGRDHMVNWKRIAFKANDRIALDEVDSSGISGYTLQQLDNNLLESKVKKTYTKKQITEAIAYWQKQLRAGNYKKVNESQTNDDGTVKPYNVGDILWDTYEDEELEPVKVKQVIKTPHTSKYGTIYYYSYECFTLGRGIVTLDHFQLKPLKLKQ